MKKILSVLLVVLMLVGMLPMNAIHAHAAETTETLNIYGSTGTKTSDSSSISWTSNNVTFTNGKGSTAIRTSDSDHYRLYQNSSVTISAPGNITKIVVTCTSSTYATALKNSAGSEATASGSTVTIIPTADSDTYIIKSMTAQSRIKTVAVTYAEAEAACDHNYVAETTAPSCTEAGKTVYTCSLCGDSYEETIAATGHSYSEVVTPPTATEQGYTTYTCGNCGDTYQGNFVPALGVTYIVSFVVPEGVTAIADMECNSSGITLPTAGVPTGDIDYTFAGWSATQIDNSVEAPTIYSGSYTATENITLYAVYTYEVAGAGSSSSYVLTDIADISATDYVVITMTNSSGTVYALSSANGTSKAPGATAVTVSGNALSNDPAADLIWNVGGSQDAYIFYPNGSTTTWLYCTNTNNGVRVGNNANNTFMIDGTYGYLFNNGTSRYVGVYNNADWRCYTPAPTASNNSNIKDQTLGFYVKSDGAATYYTTVIGSADTECQHTNTETTTVDATCTEAGSVTVTCTDCQAVISTETIEATGHSYNDVVTAPTCTEGGYTTHTCSVCGHSYTDAQTEATGHTYVNGTCSACGESEPVASSDKYYIAAIRSSGNYFFMKSELTTTSTKRYVAVDSGLTALPEVITEPAAEYVFVLEDNGDGAYCIYAEGIDGDAKYLGWTSGNSGAFVTQANAKAVTITEKDNGSVTISFDTRNLTMNNTTGNDYFAWYTSTQATVYLIPVEECTHENTENRDAVAATCTTVGYTAGVYCTDCGKYISGHEEIAALGHSYTSVTTDPTCTEAGKTVYTCSVCGDSYEEEIPALGHSYTAVTTDPTCTEAGKTVYTCSVCSHSYEEEIPAPGHTEVIDAGKAATCTESGLTEGKHCSVCNTVLVAQEEISALGHNYQAVVTAPTCTTPGFTTHTCQNCGDSYTDSETDALGHTTVTDAYVAPTCTATGLTEGSHCSVCNEVFVAQEEISALGHDWDAGEVTQAATCTATGVITYTCNTCGETKTEIIPMTEHSYEGVSADGMITYTCTVCGHSETKVDDSQLVGTYQLVTDITDILEGGVFVVAAKSGDSYYAMENLVTSNPDQILVTVNDNNQVIYSSGYPVPVWMVGGVNGISVTLTPNGTDYLAWSSGTGFSAADAPYLWTVNPGDTENSFIFTSTTTSDRAITLSATNGFTCYSTNTEQNTDLYLFKLVKDENPTEYTLTFMENGVVTGTMSAQTNDQMAVVDEMPGAFGEAPAGYSFVGWLTQGQEESLYVRNDAVLYRPGQVGSFTGNTTLYALYTRHDANAVGLNAEYKLVTGAEDLTPGGHYVIVSWVDADQEKLYAMTSDQQTKTRGAVLVTKVDDSTVSFTNDDNVAIFQLAKGADDGTYGFLDTKMGQFLYCYASGEAGLKSQDELNSAASFQIEIASDGVSIVIFQVDGYNNRNMLKFNYNNLSDLGFGCYSDASGRTNHIYLYKAISTDGADYYTTVIDCEHSYVADESSYVAPTCTETGYALYACEHCGNRYVEEIAALGHKKVGTVDTTTTDTNGNTVPVLNYHCENCDAALGSVSLKFVSSSVTLHNTLIVNFLTGMDIDGTDDYAGFENVYAIFEYGNRVGEYQLTASLNGDKVSNDKYVFPCERITPSQIGDTITATLYGTYEGTVYSYQMTYSVSQYCYAALESSGNTELNTLLVDLLYYCDAARAYTTYKADEKVTDGLTDEQKAYATTGTPARQSILNAKYETVDAPKASWKGVSLVMYHATRMRLRFEAIEGVDVSALTAKAVVNNEERDAVIVEEDGLYYVYVDGLKAFEMRDAVYITLYEGDTAISNTLAYSIESYVFSKQNDQDEKLAALVIAMMHYGDSAKAFLN